MNTRRVKVAALIAIAAAVALTTLAGIAQTTTPSPEEDGTRGDRVMFSSPFGRADFSGGYLKYSYLITREGAARSSTTTTEITPLGDGSYSIVSSSTETVPLDLVHIGFYGIPMMTLGVRIPDSGSTGTIDLSPLSNITSAAIEPGKNYILPDGGRFQAGATGSIAGVDVVYGTYTHADYSNVEIQFAFATDLALRGLMPFPAMMEFRYSKATDEPLETYSLVKLTEFAYRP